MKKFRGILRLIWIFIGGLIFSLIIYLIIYNSFVNPPIGKETDRLIFANYEFTSQDGEKINLIDKFEGNAFLVDFWTLGCSFCLDDLKAFYDLDFSQKPTFNIVAVNKDEFERWNEYLQKNGFTNTSNIVHLNLDDPSILTELNVEFFPTYFLVDENGEIQSRCSYNFVISKIKRHLGNSAEMNDYLKGVYSILPCDGLGKPILAYTLVVFPIMVIVLYMIKRRR